MHCQAVRAELLDLPQRVLYVLGLLARKSEYDVHIDIIESGFPGHLKGFLCILHRMVSSDQIKRLLIHCLRIY